LAVDGKAARLKHEVYCFIIDIELLRSPISSSKIEKYVSGISGTFEGCEITRDRIWMFFLS